MKTTDPYGIASHKAKREAVAQREQQNDHLMSELLHEIKVMNARLATIEEKIDGSK